MLVSKVKLVHLIGQRIIKLLNYITLLKLHHSNYYAKGSLSGHRQKVGKISEFFTFGPWVYLTESNYIGIL